ncbi:MAG TPA: hypothetical protein VFF47_03050 [Nitrospirota bacterium]|nr:hypothetical protein [Nitrospirota bacterium]
MKPPDILAAIKPVVEAFEKLFSTNWTGIVWEDVYLIANGMMLSVF